MARWVGAVPWAQEPQELTWLAASCFSPGDAVLLSPPSPVPTVGGDPLLLPEKGPHTADTAGQGRTQDARQGPQGRVRRLPVQTRPSVGAGRGGGPVSLTLWSRDPLLSTLFQQRSAPVAGASTPQASLQSRRKERFHAGDSGGRKEGLLWEGKLSMGRTSWRRRRPSENSRMES